VSAKAAGKPTVVVDGSNLATEGRTTPSLVQLDEAVRAYLEENPKSEIIVVADATFEHRVAPADRARFKEAELAGEIVTPPAGAVGRGDAFILKIADRVGAVVLSNDSFQEFQEQYPWLFAEGRLVGGKPVPGVGWVFTPRLPVRGARTPREVRKLKVPLPSGAAPTIGATLTPIKAPAKVAKPAKVAAKPARPVKAAKAEPTKAEPTKVAKATRTHKAEPAKASKATKVAKSSKVAKVDKPARAHPEKAGGRKDATRTATPVMEPAVALRRARQPVNPEGDFERFVDQHRVRSHVTGKVVAFSSHGAIIGVDVEGARVECYAPTTRLGNPPPLRARDVLKRGETRDFRLVSVDRERRIAELALR
jgi:hypothetical protein